MGKMLDQQYLWKDRIYPEGEKPEKLDLLVKGKRGKLFCTCFLSGGAGKHPAVVICHGFPGNERNLDLAAALRRAGFHVITFHYSGSWGSEGEFSFRNCLEDIDTILEMLAENTAIEADLRHVFLWGHSMGGFLSFHTLVRQSDEWRSEHQVPAPACRVAGAVLAMPADFGLMVQLSEQDPAMKEETMSLLKEGSDWLVGTSGDQLYREGAEYSEDKKMERLFHYVKNVPILWISGLQDKLVPSELMLDGIMKQAEEKGSGDFSRVDMDTDHMASDRRCQLAEVSADWLIDECRKQE
ncbi:MAG: alpha/beta fold hydrolase [Parasporobacterium sp.]|nr:alpha/beta fold hydrolase [Parasporobacterium sp.]